MSPRPYRLGQRQAAAEQTRARILTAARELLLASEGFAGFSIDAVARQANVARMTVYYQFGSKRGLLEALFDDLAARGQVGERLAAAFRHPEPRDGLAAFIAAFNHFWASDRLVIRRLRSLAALDPDFEQGVRARDEWRREGLQVLVRRLLAPHGPHGPHGPHRPHEPHEPHEPHGGLAMESSESVESPESLESPEALDEVVDLLHMLTSFESFDTLAGATRRPEDVTSLVHRLAGAALGLAERVADG